MAGELKWIDGIGEQNAARPNRRRGNDEMMRQNNRRAWPEAPPVLIPARCHAPPQTQVREGCGPPQLATSSGRRGDRCPPSAHLYLPVATGALPYWGTRLVRTRIQEWASWVSRRSAADCRLGSL